jgi:hypothetical protein
MPTTGTPKTRFTSLELVELGTWMVARKLNLLAARG